jgi:xanthine dehydrogenase large subunit
MPDRLAVARSLAHDSATKHVAGEAVYIDDMPEPARCLEVYVAWADRAHARLVSLDLEPVRRAPGVVAVITTDDIPGHTDISPVGRDDEPVFCTGIVQYWGQALFAVAADHVATR